VLAIAALAGIAAWTPASGSTPGVTRPALVLAALLALSTIVAALSLARFSSGVRSRRLGERTDTSDSGPAFSGTPAVAIDSGPFVLRLDRWGHRRLWLPPQRRGPERGWQALRCALYSTPSPPPAPTAPAPAPLSA
jgi:hypothetical protein